MLPAVQLRRVSLWNSGRNSDWGIDCVQLADAVAFAEHDARESCSHLDCFEQMNSCPHLDMTSRTYFVSDDKTVAYQLAAHIDCR